MPNFFNPYRLQSEDPKICCVAIKHLVAVIQLYSIVTLAAVLYQVPKNKVEVPVALITYSFISFVVFAREMRITMMILFWINVVFVVVFGSYIANEGFALIVSPFPTIMVYDKEKVKMVEIEKPLKELLVYFGRNIALFLGTIVYTWLCLALVKAVDLKKRNMRKRATNSAHVASLVNPDLLC